LFIVVAMTGLSCLGRRGVDCFDSCSSFCHIGCLLLVGREGSRGSGEKNGEKHTKKTPKKTKRYASPSEKLMLM
jgi:hypothetical protein